jgi:hypothetical protein
MPLSTKIIGLIALTGILYSIIKLFESGTGGGALENAFAGILYTTVAVFVASLVSIIIHRKSIKDRKEEVYILAFTGFIILIVMIGIIREEIFL